MLLSIIRYIKGYLKIQVIGYSPERFLNACSHRGIYLWDLKSSKNSYEMCISVKGFRQLKPIIKKTGTKVVITGRFGLPFFLHRYRKRKLFFIGAFACIILIYMMSLFIWNIDISGNSSRTDETLLTFLESRDVVHGMKKSDVNCARIVKDIRKQFDDIIWVSASIKGTRLIIQIKENEDSFAVKNAGAEEAEEESPDSEKPVEGTDIIADQDCVITEMITRKGTPMVHPGDEVKKGDVLVSGRIEVMNDSKEVTGYQYQHSDAAIRGRTSVPYENTHALTYKVKEYLQVQKEESFLKIGSYFFCLGSLKNNYKEFDLTADEHQLSLGEHFWLPFSYGSRIIRPYRSKEKPYTEQQLQELLTEEFQKTCEDMEKKGVEIIENDVKIYTESDLAKARGTLTIITEIGEEKATEIIAAPESAPVEQKGENTDGND